MIMLRKAWFTQNDLGKSRFYLKKANTLLKVMDERQERFYKMAWSQIKQFEEVEQQHALARVGSMGMRENRLQRNFFMILLFGLVIGFIAYRATLVTKYSRLRHEAQAFPVRICGISFSQLGGIFFYAKKFS